jgi:hypothetical protein
MQHYSDPGLDAELAYRRERAMAAGRASRRSQRPRRRWLRRAR